MTKSILPVLLSFILVSGLALASAMHVSAESPGVITIISSDTTWTKAGSPYDLTGQLLVSNGATLTIEAGVTVNLNGYDVLINGTLCVIGSSNEKIYLNNGTIDFSRYSYGWDEQTGTGCKIENAVLVNVNIVSSVSLNIRYSSIDRQFSVGGSSIIQGNTLDVLLITDGSPIVTHNTISEIPCCYGSPEISYNTIGSLGNSSFFGGSPLISHNTIDTIGDYLTHSSGKIEIRPFNANSPVITHNIVKKGIYVKVVPGQINYIPVYYEDTVIANNTVTGYTYSCTHTVSLTTSGIILEGKGNISSNKISGCSTGIEGGTIIEGNFLFNNTHGIMVRGGDVVIRGNNITLGDTGIYGDVNTDVMIENNFISRQNSTGISITGNYGTIQNNTIFDTGTAITLNRTLFWVKINYNNIEGYRENSIYLDNAQSDEIDATDNWWGTTDIQAINQTIHDFKYDFYLGAVNFTPILTKPNPEALPSEIPEFPAWIVLPMFLAATLTVMAFKKKIGGHSK